MSESLRANQFGRAGRRVLQILVKHAIDSIPMVGPYVKIGWEIMTAVKEEFEKEEHEALSDQQAVEALHSLSVADTQNIVDSAMASEEGRRATRLLTEQQIREVRHRLISIPTEIERIIADLEKKERDRLTAWEDACKQAQATRKAQLDEQLKQQLKDEKLHDAYETAAEILTIEPGDPETLKVIDWLEPKLGRGFWASWGWATIGFLLWAMVSTFSLIAEGMSPQQGGKTPGAGMFCVTLMVLPVFAILLFKDISYRIGRRRKKTRQEA